MSEDQKVVTQPNDNPTDEVVNNQPEIKDPNAVLAKNKELLGKLSSTKTELDELREFKRKQEIEAEERKGNYDGVIKRLREENEELRTSNKKEKVSRVFSAYETQIKEAARAEGCVNPDKLLRLMSTEQFKEIQLDDSLNANKDDLKAVMAKLKAEHEDIGLFRTAAPRVNTAGGGFSTGNIEKSVKEMTADEIRARLRSNF